MMDTSYRMHAHRLHHFCLGKCGYGNLWSKKKVNPECFKSLTIPFYHCAAWHKTNCCTLLAAMVIVKLHCRCLCLCVSHTNGSFRSLRGWLSPRFFPLCALSFLCGSCKALLSSYPPASYWKNSIFRKKKKKFEVSLWAC